MKFTLRKLTPKQKERLEGCKATLEELLALNATSENSLKKYKAKLAELDEQKEKVRGRAESGMDAEASRQFSELLAQIARLSRTIEKEEEQSVDPVQFFAANDDSLDAVSDLIGSTFQQQAQSAVREALAPFARDVDGLERMMIGASGADSVFSWLQGTIHPSHTPGAGGPELARRNIRAINAALAGEPLFEFAGLENPGRKEKSGRE